MLLQKICLIHCKTAYFNNKAQTSNIFNILFRYKTQMWKSFNYCASGLRPYYIVRTDLAAMEIFIFVKDIIGCIIIIISYSSSCKSNICIRVGKRK